MISLYKKYIKHITAICFNYLGKYDYHQDAAIEIYSKLKKELLKKEFHDKAKFINWLSVVVKNHCISHLRKINSIDRTKNQYELLQESVELPNLERNDNITSSELKEAISALNEKQQKCILYFYFRGYKITDKVLKNLEADNFDKELIIQLAKLKDKEIRGKGFFFDLLQSFYNISIDKDSIVKIINYSFYSEKMSYKEISDITGYPLEKVKSYIQNGKLNMKKLLTNKINREY
ncbi:MAG: sigma-70 family RNA polymerase sigma factor [Rhodothermaceae bacterium]